MSSLDQAWELVNNEWVLFDSVIKEEAAKRIARLIEQVKNAAKAGEYDRGVTARQVTMKPVDFIAALTAHVKTQIESSAELYQEFPLFVEKLLEPILSTFEAQGYGRGWDDAKRPAPSPTKEAS